MQKHVFSGSITATPSPAECAAFNTFRWRFRFDAHYCGSYKYLPISSAVPQNVFLHMKGGTYAAIHQHKASVSVYE